MMRVLVDTNVIISALLFPTSAPSEVLDRVLSTHRLVLTQWIIDELFEVVSRKRSDLLPALDSFLTRINYEMAGPVPYSRSSVTIADEKDQPILDAALDAEVDVIVTGDKHFLVLDLPQMRIVTPRVFLILYWA
ncbi:MAG: putative toxin-antitoxin system toxin component, PIN family [Ancrocorticia sp.]|uniref:putative toxin-antitoxin system toxin component, PIN family n=1 Tax=Ancrocorticia sp. TaxID=2593684 RepID=UPI003F90E699